MATNNAVNNTLNQPNIVGVIDASNAAAGSVGQLISSIVASPGGALTTNTSADVTSISLTAGDWDVWGNVFFTPGSTVTSLVAWSSLTSATLPNSSLYNSIDVSAGLGACGINTPFVRINVSTTTTVYLSARAQFAGGLEACGGIFARRVR